MLKYQKTCQIILLILGVSMICLLYTSGGFDPGRGGFVSGRGDGTQAGRQLQTARKGLGAGRPCGLF